MENTVDLRIVEEPKKPLAMHPKKFAMWLFMASVMMLFMALTSAYIVRRAEGNWVFFEVPSFFYWSTGIVITSSIAIQVAFFLAKKNLLSNVKLLLCASLFLSIAFLATQYLGLIQLIREGHYFTGGNVSESFFYVFPWLHGAHIVSAIIFLMIVCASAFQGKIHSKNMAQMEMCTTYWHFLGGLWLYLFIFLLLYR